MSYPGSLSIIPLLFSLRFPCGGAERLGEDGEGIILGEGGGTGKRGEGEENERQEERRRERNKDIKRVEEGRGRGGKC